MKNYSLHGGKHTKLYKIWCSIKQRCYNKNNTHYKYYGGRGISVCLEWQNNFAEFRSWANKNGYEDGLSIERIDVNSGYEPNNCKWITISEQCNNKQNSKRFQIDGETLSLKQISEKYKINYDTLYYRICKLNWNIDEAISREVKNMPRRKSSSGERYIYKSGSGFKVIINKNHYGLRQTLDEAIKLRNIKLKELTAKNV